MGQSLGSVFLPWETDYPLFRFFYIRHLNWTNSMSVPPSYADHDWGIVGLSVPRNVRSGEMKASGKLSV